MNVESGIACAFDSLVRTMPRRVMPRYLGNPLREFLPLHAPLHALTKATS